MRNGFTIQPKESKKVVKIKISAKINNSTGTVKLTDIMLQGGSVATPWMGHPSEVKWSFDTN